MTTTPTVPPSDLQTLVLAVAGMTCASCVRHVQQALEHIDGVHTAQVDRVLQQAVITYDAARVRPQQLAGAVVDAGYEVASEELTANQAGTTRR